ncbi:MAG: hypothetical protein J6J72_00605, partial [Tyzzerella sp.]|nr:hypothetical protein [Tyzzerella sp.]
MKLLKRIGAMVLAVALVIGGLPMAHLSVKAGTQHNSTLDLTLKDYETASLLLSGTDEFLKSKNIADDTAVVLTPNDASSGIYLNGGTADIWLYKYNYTNSYYAVGGVESLAQAGTTITIKGTFRCSDQGTYGDDTIVFEERTFVYDGSKWSKKVASATEFKATTFGVVAQPTFVAGANDGEGNCCE